MLTGKIENYKKQENGQAEEGSTIHFFAIKLYKKLFKFYPLVLLGVFFHHASAIFRSVAMAMHLKIPSPDEKIHYKIFQKQNLNSF